MKTYSEKEYKELLEITGFLADVLNEIAYGFVHESGDIPGEGCDCPRDYAKAAIELSYEDFISWKGERSDYSFGWKRNLKNESSEPESQLSKDLRQAYEPLFQQLADEALESLRQFKMMDDEMKRKKEIKND
jgi:hypothetical protein